jgi:RNA polymerase sigma-70 factor, ECF subfamily
MSALQHLASYQQIADRPFVIKKGRTRKITPFNPASSTSEKSAPTPAAEDPALVRRAIAGDSKAQTQLFATHTPMLYRIAFKVLRNRENAEDAVQDTWCRAYSKLHTFEGRSSLSTWLTRIAINSALMIRRRNKRLFEVSLNEASDDEKPPLLDLVDDGPTPEEACRFAEMNELLAHQIHSLPSRTRKAFLLRGADGFTTSESIELLGISKSAFKSRVRRARRRLAQSVLKLLDANRQRNHPFAAKNCDRTNCSSPTTLRVRSR